MRDDRRIFIPEPDPKASDGFATWAAWLFGGVMTLALIDRGVTLAWAAIHSWWTTAVNYLGSF